MSSLTLLKDTKGNEIGKYDEKKRYAFTNWSNADFTFKWGGESYTVGAGDVKEYPQYLAFHACTHFVDREMNKAGYGDRTNIPEIRGDFETKTINEIVAGQESPEYASLREKIRKEIEAENVKKEAVTASVEKRGPGRPPRIKEETTPTNENPIAPTV